MRNTHRVLKALMTWKNETKKKKKRKRTTTTTITASKQTLQKTHK